MANQYDKGMDDYYSGKDIPKNPTLEYFRGYGYAESMSRNEYFPEQVDDRVQEQEMEELTCMVCGETFTGYESVRCCSGMDCACRGMPIDPVVCSKECYDKLPFRSGQNSAGAVELTSIFKTNSHHV